MPDQTRPDRREDDRKDETRIDPETGEEQVLVRGYLGPYWQDKGRVTRDPYGDIDWEA